jgi:hypothetical protein
MTETEKAHSVVSRVLNLSIFFAGVGVFAIAGFALYQIELFSEYQMTYFSVGVAVGLVGLLLWLVTQ